jgi:hypothetical protein
MTLVVRPGHLPGDALFSNVSLLLKGDGTNGSTTIVDSSPSPKIVTPAGGAQISTDQSKFGGASVFIGFGANTGYLDLPANSAFLFPTDFTFECWLYITQTGTGFATTVIETAGNFTNGLVLRGDNLQTSWSWTVGGSGIGGGSLTLNEWNHMAVARSGSTIRVFKDGVQQGTATNSITINPTAGVSRIGEGIAAIVRGFNGYIDDLRITKGVARYTANFATI